MPEKQQNHEYSRVTLREVAEAAGVSKSVAQRALAGRPGVAESTAERVRAAADELGYRPDPALAKLAAARWRSRTVSSGTTVAWLVEDSESVERPNPAQKVMTEALMREADALGYKVAVFTRTNHRPQRLAAILASRGIEIVLTASLVDPAWVAAFPWDRFRCAAVSLGEVRPPIPLVHRNILECVETGWRNLREKGCKRIGALLYEGDLYAHTRMAHAAVLLRMAMDETRSPHPPPLFLHYQGDPRSQIQAYLRKHRPDGLLAHSPYSARMVRESGLFEEKNGRLICLKLYPWNTEFPGFAFHAEGMIREAFRHAAGSERGLRPETPTLTLVSCPWSTTG
ncbi:MAG: LacI family DNA-binding transcriptional regulator [Verrucomicrobia bacterium]|nr:LacI family DNA-binding transcriptional regulator [Verrucomicrobiota bacterium]MCH8514400.1 LacI family DNA-binding transcriptional regulator [Kiritimatiellia bacterium]